MKNIHIIPTDKPSRLKRKNDEFDYSPAMMFIEEKNWKNQYICITSDEVPKLDEWGINTKNNVVFKCKGFTPDEYDKKYCKKIILTTDMDLINDGVQAIDDEFLEWFVNNPSCERVEVSTYHVQGDISGKLHYKIIIPQGERKQEFLEKISSIDLSPEFQQLISDNLDDLTSYEPKQETLEEAAEIWVNNRFTKQICGNESYPDIHASKERIVESHIIFAKWQSERMYSEEEVRKIAEEVRWQAIGNPLEFTKNFEKWFEQFKKK